MVFATNSKGEGFYSVHLKAIYLREGGGVSAKIDDASKLHRLDVSESSLNRGNVIVDSGTTDSYFTRELAGAFKSAWTQITGQDYNHNPISLTDDQIAALPTIIIVMEGHRDNPDLGDVPGYVGGALGDEFWGRDVVWAIPGSHYMEFDPDTSKYVARFYTDESSGSVLGANAMMGHDIYFDTSNGRIGIAESDCDYNALLLQEGSSISVAPEGQQMESTKTEVVEERPEENEAGDDEYDDDAEYEEYEGTTEYDNAGESEGEMVQYYEDDESYEEAVEDNGSSESGSSKGGEGSSSSSYSDMANTLLEDMKHECRSSSCRGVAAFFILAAASFVLLMIRRTMARRRVVRQYQEAELEISDLALNSDSDDEDGGYEDMPRMT
jgi:hypothetical protein